MRACSESATQPWRPTLMAIQLFASIRKSCSELRDHTQSTGFACATRHDEPCVTTAGYLMSRGLSGYNPDSDQPSDERRRDQRSRRSAAGDREVFSAHSVGLTSPPRRAPRVSVVVVLPENQRVSAASLASLSRVKDHEVEVLVAYAGQPSDLNALQRSVRGAQFILAPAGTSAEDLRELAMHQARGDIVTLLSGALLSENRVTQQRIFRSS